MKGGTKAKGFTIIEVLLFLAITGFLFVGLMIGVGSTISRHRYNDSVQDFAEFMRSVYSQVVNVQNPRQFSSGNNAICDNTGDGIIQTSDNGNQIKINPNWESMIDGASGTASAYPGKSDCLIYGKLVTFGERTTNAEDRDNVYVYDVIGVDLEAGGDIYDYPSTKAALIAAVADIIHVSVSRRDDHPDQPMCRFAPIGGLLSYTPRWSASAQLTNTTGRLRMALLIVRSPLTGSVHTYVLENDTIDVQEYTTGNNANLNNSGNGNCEGNLGTHYTNTADKTLQKRLGEFNEKEVHICVGSDDVFAINGKRRDILIKKNGRNSTAVELVAADSEANQCD